MGDKGTNENQDIDLDALLKNINGLIELANGETIELDEEHNPTEVGQADYEKLYEKDFYDPQIEEIQRGFKEDLDAGIYARDCFSWMQMREIRLGLQAQIDIKPYYNQLFNAEQMRQIRLGIIAGIEVSDYAKLIYSASDMKQKRRLLLAEAYEANGKLKDYKAVDEDTKIEVYIPEDHMSAYVKLPKTGAEKYTIYDIKKVLKLNDVENGISDDVLEQMLKEQYYGKRVKIADGVKPVLGKDGWFELTFEQNKLGAPKLLPDGRVDYSSDIIAETVSPGQLLATYHPAEKGVNGITVTGVDITGCSGKELPPLHGRGTILDNQLGTYTANIKGYVNYSEEDGALNVFRIYNITSDVTRYSGKINFDGTIHITGNVNDMSYISAGGDIIVDGFVGAAIIHAGNNITLKHGVNASGGGSIEAGGRIIGEFFEMANLSARDFIEGNYFLNCNITTDTKLIVKGNKARILGGNISAVLAVESAYIANAGKQQAIIKVGDMEDIEQKISRLQRKVQKAGEDIERLEEGKKKLTELYGEDLTQESDVFTKTCQAVESLNVKKEFLEQDIIYLGKMKARACNAYIKVTRELSPDVFLSINGRKTTTDKFFKGIVLTKDNIKKGGKREPNG